MLWLKGRDFNSVRKISYISPLIFIPIQTLYTSVTYMIDKLSNPNLVGLGGSIIVSSVYIVILGYAYVLFVNVAYFALTSANILKKAN